MTLYYEPDPDRAHPAGGPLARAVQRVPDLTALTAALDAAPETLLVVLGSGVPLAQALDVAAYQRIHRPALGVVLVRDQVEVDVLAAAIRAGVREVVSDGDPAGLQAACERSLEVSRQLAADRPAPAPAPAPATGVVVTVFAGKGGCGKSTVATNLAVTLASGGARRVCLVDLDLQFGDVGIMVQREPERGIADAVGMAGRLDESGVGSLLTRYLPNLDVLLAPAGPADSDHVTRELVTELVTVLRGMYDVVVVDTPPYFSDQVLAALDLTDWFVLVVTPDLPALKSLRLTLDMFDLLEYPRERRVPVLNRADSQVGLTVADIEKALGTPMSVLMPSSRDVPVSVNRGRPLAAENPRHPVSRAVRELAEKCVGASPPPAGHQRGLLRRRG